MLQKPGSLIWLLRRQSRTRARLQPASSERCFSSSSRKLSSQRLGIKTQPKLPFELQFQSCVRKARTEDVCVSTPSDFAHAWCIGVQVKEIWHKYREIKGFISVVRWRTLLLRFYGTFARRWKPVTRSLLHCNAWSEFRRLVPSPCSKCEAYILATFAAGSLAKREPFSPPVDWIGTGAAKCAAYSPLINV